MGLLQTVTKRFTQTLATMQSWAKLVLWTSLRTETQNILFPERRQAFPKLCGLLI